MLEIKKILFPIDLEENASKILPYVLSVSEKYMSTIFLLHVVQDTPSWYYPCSMNILQTEALDSTIRALDLLCMDITCEGQSGRSPNFQRRIVHGDPATQILATIKLEDVDLVIMGTHGRKGLNRAIFGSVAEKVIKRSTVPVLIINTYEHTKMT